MTVAVVTGGAGAIGKSIATRLLAEGHRVALLDMASTLDEVVEDLRVGGGEVQGYPCDVTDPERVEEVGQHVAGDLGVVDLLVNNAGVYEVCDTVDLPWERWQAVMNVNVGAAFLCCKTFGRGMLDAGAGVIVNIASGRAIGGLARGVHYAASKAAVISLTRSLAQEWAPAIRVNAVVPGLTDTPMPRSAGMTTEKMQERARQRVPLQRVGQPEDVAGVVAFLSGPDAVYMTGQSIGVNGGVIMV